jgi:hypothetical protein
MTIVIVWAILVDATETMEVSVIVARLLEASVGVRGGALGFVTGGGTIGGRGRGGRRGPMGDVVFQAGQLEFPASRGAIQTCCRESMPFQMTAGWRGSRAYASDLIRSLTFLATDPWTISVLY